MVQYELISKSVQKSNCHAESAISLQPKAPWWW